MFFSGGLIMSEFNRLFEVFQKRSPKEAAQWKHDTKTLGVLKIVQRLADAYQRQNEEIHGECLRCKGDVSCAHKQREINWIARGGPWKFPFAECGLSHPVPDAAWQMFALLLSCTEHALEKERGMCGCHLKPEQLWDPDGAEWHDRLAKRFAPIRKPTAKDGPRPIEGYLACH